MTTQELNNLSIEELRQLNNRVVRTINRKKQDLAMEIKDTLSVGDIVKVNHHKLSGINMVVEQVKRTKAILAISGVGNPERFNVPISLIQSAYSI
jgi:transcription antitermination factor NusG